MQHNTPSLQTSKGLKDAGFPQDKAQCYYDSEDIGDGSPGVEYFLCTEPGNFRKFAAPTAQELADELPVSIEHEFPNSLCITKDTDKYWASYDHVDEDIIAASGDSITEALAQLYIKLNGDSK